MVLGNEWLSYGVTTDIDAMREMFWSCGLHGYGETSKGLIYQLFEDDIWVYRSRTPFIDLIVADSMRSVKKQALTHMRILYLNFRIIRIIYTVRFIAD